MDQLVKERDIVKESETPIIPIVIPVITIAVASTLGDKLCCETNSKNRREQISTP